MKLFFANLIALVLCFAIPHPAEASPRMDKEQLRSLLDSEDLVLLDVRGERAWNASDLKIRGAVRIDGHDLNAVKNYDKKKIFVFYCS
ncbi:hypothetical protein SAMN05660330_02439 [Desulforhopalus singaporensis]|uniref:Rhodanese domain-containing protein n=2 Tax=Desulforhopalus singaporensis TaxID=91360 RepID=A0A1H0RV99_9BACT|nr:hypothetical protein SAMN05660330_02439 [Desulforhopalus singaporensis]